MIVDITPQNFHAELIDASLKKPVVIYFHAPQMPECQAMTPWWKPWLVRPILASPWPKSI